MAPPLRNRILISTPKAYSSTPVRSKNSQKSAAPSVSFVSLGCPKALVDSERIITRLRAEGYALSRDHKGADLVIVNTCGFLDSAQTAGSLRPLSAKPWPKTAR